MADPNPGRTNALRSPRQAREGGGCIRTSWPLWSIICQARGGVNHRKRPPHGRELR